MLKSNQDTNQNMFEGKTGIQRNIKYNFKMTTVTIFEQVSGFNVSETSLL